MIQTKEDLRLYLEKDKQALGITRKRPCLVGDDIWKFEIALRYHEYLTNVNGGGGGPALLVGNSGAFCIITLEYA